MPPVETGPTFKPRLQSRTPEFAQQLNEFTVTHPMSAFHLQKAAAEDLSNGSQRTADPTAS